jgi:hypothetical protein
MVVREVASRYARSFRAPFISPPIIKVLGWVTVVVVPIVLVIALLIPAPSLLVGVINLAFFAALSVLAIPALKQIDQASLAWREVSTSIREALLKFFWSQPFLE